MPPLRPRLLRGRRAPGPRGILRAASQRLPAAGQSLNGRGVRTGWAGLARGPGQGVRAAAAPRRHLHGVRVSCALPVEEQRRARRGAGRREAGIGPPQARRAQRACIEGLDQTSKTPELQNITSYIDLTDQYESCDATNYCHTSIDIKPNGDREIKGSCVAKKAAGEVCVARHECKSTYCLLVNATSSVRQCADALSKEDGLCTTSRDCERALGCNMATKKCIKRAAAGEDCAAIECVFDYFCNTTSLKCAKMFSVADGQIGGFFLFCQSGHIYSNGTCKPYGDLPTLDLPEKTEFLKCSQDDDCTYHFANKTLADVGENRCFYESYTEKEQRYCRFGGGEVKLVNSMKSLIEKYTSETEMDQIAYATLADPIRRIDLNEPGNCTIFDVIKQKYGSGESLFVGALLLALLLLI